MKKNQILLYRCHPWLSHLSLFAAFIYPHLSFPSISETMRRDHYELAKTNDDIEDGQEHDVESPKQSSLAQMRCASIAFWVFIALTVLAVLLLVQKATTDRSWNTRPCICGSSAAEAIANGCKFDPYAMAWLPDHCRDDGLIELFTELGQEQHHNWTLFDYPATHEMQIEEAASLASDPFDDPTPVTTTRGWHHSKFLTEKVDTLWILTSWSSLYIRSSEVLQDRDDTSRSLGKVSRSTPRW